MVQWTADKDQILLKGVFQFCDIKSSAQLLKFLSDLIGEDCTPKAVSHRLNNIKKTGKGTNSAGDSMTPTPSKSAANKRTPGKTTTTNSGGRGRGRPRKVNVTKDPKETNTQSEDDETIESPTMNRKRARQMTEAVEEDDEAEDSDQTPVKKIKLEPEGMEDMLRGAHSQLHEYESNMSAEDEI